MNTRRENAALLAPGLLAFGFVLLDSAQPLTDRLLSAFGAGLAVHIAGLVGMALMSVLAAWLCGEGSDAELPPTRQLLAGALLATFVWIWWQHDRDEVIAELATCVQVLGEDAGYKPREAVLECYRNRGDGDYSGSDD